MGRAYHQLSMKRTLPKKKDAGFQLAGGLTHQSAFAVYKSDTNRHAAD